MFDAVKRLPSATVAAVVMNEDDADDGVVDGGGGGGGGVVVVVVVVVVAVVVLVGSGISVRDAGTFEDVLVEGDKVIGTGAEEEVCTGALER